MIKCVCATYVDVFCIEAKGKPNQYVLLLLFLICLGEKKK